jgi:hypothetical protein
MKSKQRINASKTLASFLTTATQTAAWSSRTQQQPATQLTFSAAYQGKLATMGAIALLLLRCLELFLQFLYVSSLTSFNFESEGREKQRLRRDERLTRN